MDDGSQVLGETNINASQRRIVELQIVPANPEPLPQALAAIAAADVITMGPGSLFTSLVTNLLVRGIPEAIAASPALKVFICNLMTEANESLHMKASDHIRAIYDHSPSRIFDYALVNTAPVSASMRERYAEEHAEQVEADIPAMEAARREMYSRQLHHGKSFCASRHRPSLPGAGAAGKFRPSHLRTGPAGFKMMAE